MTKPIVLKFGTKAFRIIDAKWNSGKQMAVIRFEDDDGKEYQTEGWGVSIQEQRQAVTEAVVSAYKRAQIASDTQAMLIELAKACGNEPYADYE